MNAPANLQNALTEYLICPYCRHIKEAALAYRHTPTRAALECTVCKRCYPIVDDIIDFCPGIEQRSGIGLAQKFMEHKGVVSIYERYFRPAFTRLGSSIKYDEEIQWLSRIPTGIPVTAALDLACGTGKYSRLMYRLYRPRFVFAVDISLAMLQKAAACSMEKGRDHIIYIRGDAGALPLRSGMVQRANCFGALHLFPDVTGAIGEIARILPGGAAFSCLTSRQTNGFFINAGQSAFSRLFSFHFFDEDWLEKSLATAGFELEEKEHKNMVLLFCGRKKVSSVET